MRRKAASRKRNCEGRAETQRWKLPGSNGEEIHAGWNRRDEDRLGELPEDDAASLPELK